MSVVHNYVWDPAYANPSGGTGGWVKQTAGGGGGGGGGGATATEINGALKATPQPTVEHAIDSAGNPLPLHFGSYPESINETNPNAITVTRAGAGGTYIQTITVSGLITTVSQWVRQP